MRISDWSSDVCSSDLARPARAPAEAGGTAMMWRRLAKWYHVREGYWFAPKLFGYGATPVTWQGWLLSFGLMLLLIAAIRFIPSDPARFTVAAALVLAFCVIAARKTDGGWRWRWGSRD